VFHRFGFGPKPGEFAQALKKGIKVTRNQMTNIAGAKVESEVDELRLVDLGKRPAPNSAGVVDFVTNMKNQREELLLWWLDRMVLNDRQLVERMTWFWHGHWATSIDKVDYALPMYKQNVTLRSHALGDFKQMSKAMVQDCALQFWLDGQTSTAKQPNENLARELMELFILGVNRYTEEDVKSLARILTGYKVNLSAGVVEFDPLRHDYYPVNLLGTLAVFDGLTASDFLVSRDNCSTFIAERIWYRFISNSEPMPNNFKNSINKAFGKRSIDSVIKVAMTDQAMQNPKYGMVKSPVEWFVGVCRALELQPSTLNSAAKLRNFLSKMGQIPFAPPSVGGWPAGEAWLTSANAQYRIEFAQWLISQSKLKTIRQTPIDDRVQSMADWLGVVSWSDRTTKALNQTLTEPDSLVLIGLCSPEYVISA
jgi:uncharacterized protein (DUF1800 family)